MIIETGEEPIVGYRVWQVHETYPHGWQLFSGPNGGVAWPFCKRIEAVCRPNSNSYPLFSLSITGASMVEQTPIPPHDSPDSEGRCYCGINAYKDCVAVQRSLSVYGEVNLWGRVIVYQDGYRAQFAYPKKLVVATYLKPKHIKRAEKIADALAFSYQVPCEVWE